MDTDKLREEYIMGDMSIASLAKEHGVSPSTLAKAGSAGKWTKLRELRKEGGDAAEQYAKRMLDMLEAILCDEKQFNRYVSRYSEYDEQGRRVQGTKEMVFAKLDTKSFRDIAAALKTLSTIESEDKKLKLDIKRLEKQLEDKRAGQEKEGGVVVIPQSDAGED